MDLSDRKDRPPGPSFPVHLHTFPTPSHVSDRFPLQGWAQWLPNRTPPPIQRLSVCSRMENFQEGSSQMSCMSIVDGVGGCSGGWSSLTSLGNRGEVEGHFLNGLRNCTSKEWVMSRWDRLCLNDRHWHVPLVALIWIWLILHKSPSSTCWRPLGVRCSSVYRCFIPTKKERTALDHSCTMASGYPQPHHGVWPSAESLWCTVADLSPIWPF